MTVINKIKNLANDPNTIKIVGTVSVDGVPHTAVKQTLRIRDDGNIEYIELLESSKSYRNITGSIWYNKKVSISLVGENRESYVILGSPERILVSGREFEEIYEKTLAEKGFDIAAVITIIPESVEKNSPQEKFAQQDESRLFYKHLDRLGKIEQ